MKKFSKRILIPLLVFCLLFPCHSSASQDVSKKEMAFGVYAIVDGQRIDLWTKGTNQYLFLPASADLNSLELHTENNQSEETLVVEGDMGSGELNEPINVQAFSSEDEGVYKLIIRDINSNEILPIKIMFADYQPSVFLYSADKENEGRDFVDASKSNVTSGSMRMIGYEGNAIYDGDLTQIKARGNSTFTFADKKSYQIKLKKKSDLLGTGETVKTWVLLAGYNDATKIHDKTIKDLSSTLGMLYVASCDWVNLYYDGEYRGLYLLSEKNQVNKTSINISDLEEVYSELNVGYGEIDSVESNQNRFGQDFLYTPDLTEPENISGGYLLEINGTQIDETNGFYTKKKSAINVKSPEWNGKEGMRYISEFYQEFEDAVFATDSSGNYTGYNEETEKYYYDYVDKDSLVQLFLLQELTYNLDEFSFSTFFYKDKDTDIMHCGPIWDQDMIFGTTWNKHASPDKLRRVYLTYGLTRIPDFQDAVREYYQRTFAEQAKALIGSEGTLVQNVSMIRKSAEMDHILWPFIRIANPYVKDHLWPDETTYQDVVDDMTNWVEKRIEFMDGIYGPGTSGPLEPGDSPGDDNGSGGNGNNGGNGGNGGTIPGGDPAPGPSEPNPEPIDDEPIPTALEFEDVPDDAYFHDAVSWAVSKDITNGIDETHFGPDASCTRAQMVTFLWRAAGSPEVPSQSASQTAAPDGGAKECPFTDVEVGSYYEKAVLWAVEKGITTGTSETTFSPEDTVTRGQSVTFLYRMKNPSQSASQTAAPDGGAKECPFADVAEDAYYYDAVLWAAKNGVTTGKTETLFAPDDDCTRAQIVTFLYRAMVE